jgi:hypothetical protein
MMNRRIGFSVILAAALTAALPGRADTTFQISPDVLQQITTERAAEPKPEQMSGHELRPISDSAAEGVYYRMGESYVGSFARSTSPATGRLTHWVFDQGVFTRVNGDRYVGTFYFFHHAHMETRRAGSDMPQSGTYIMSGSYHPKNGGAKQGIYYGDFYDNAPVAWVEADEGYMREFEAYNEYQVNEAKAAIRREQERKRQLALQAAQEEAEDDSMFGQMLALGVGAAILGAADIPGTDMMNIGSAMATDILSGGETNALQQMIVGQQSSLAAAAGASASGYTFPGGGDATAVSSRSDQVTITCPQSGVSSTIPLSYKTEGCRSAMINFAKVYACNMIDDMASAGAACQSACGHPQCLE